VTERANLWSDQDTRHRLRELSGRWGLSMQDTLRRLVAEALRQEHAREVGSSAEAGR
jgi:DNA polymerase III delta prime subunit